MRLTLAALLCYYKMVFIKLDMTNEHFKAQRRTKKKWFTIHRCLAFATFFIRTNHIAAKRQESFGPIKLDRLMRYKTPLSYPWCLSAAEFCADEKKIFWWKWAPAAHTHANLYDHTLLLIVSFFLLSIYAF